MSSKGTMARFCLLAVLCLSASRGWAEHPNIVFIYADDMGYGDCGAYNPGISIPTPHIDRLAKEGLRFTDAHAPHATCTGSRYGLLTGTSPSRTGVRNTLANSRAVIDEKEATIAQLLKDQGYRTKMVGKWHLGFNLPAGKSKKSIDADTILRAGPVDRGFDYFLGNIAGLSAFPIRGRNQVAEPVDVNAQNRLFCEDAVRIIKEHAATDGSEPLFLYYALHEPHKPQIPEKAFVGKSGAGAYGDYLVQMDHWVGEVLGAITETGLEKNTMVVFASDNGASKANAATCPGHTPNGKLSGFKAMSLEGGHRVPTVVKWPGKVPAGATTAALINHSDFFATFAELLGVDHAKRYPGSARDSHSFLPVLSDPSADHQRPPMVVVGSYRKGSWKLIADGYRGSGENPRAVALHDLAADVSEQTNLIQSHPEKAKTLLAEYRQFLLARDLKNQTQGSTKVSKPAQRRTLRSRLETGSRQTVIAYGTSLTKVGAWTDQLATVLEQNYPGQVTFINSAQGGSNSDWGSRSFEEKVIQKKPDTVFIEFAINDAVASRNTSVSHARKNLEGMIDRLLEAQPNCEIILMVMNPPVAFPARQRPNLVAYNQMYRDVARERELQLIDHFPVWEKLLAEDPGRFLQYVPDAIHPVREGALNVILPTMIEALGLAPGKPEQAQSSPCWDYLFRMMDKEVKQDRQVTREEYQQFWEKHFTRLDADENGLIEPEEYQPGGLFQHIDANADKTITPEEYQVEYEIHFKCRDTNSDGILNNGEIWKVK